MGSPSRSSHEDAPGPLPGVFLAAEGFTGPRGVRALAREASALSEAARLLRRHRAGRRQRPAYAVADRVAPHHPVVLVPGFMAGDSTLRAMAQQLRLQGYRTYRSRIRVNAGCTREAAEHLEELLEQIAERRGRRVSLVGHSLGGMLGRGLAARRPDLIEGVVALGSPVLAPGAVHRLLAWDARLLSRLHDAGVRAVMGADCFGGACAQESWEESRQPLDPSVAFTAVYSRRDGIVDWRACLDPQATHVEVRSSHCGMAVDPETIDAVVAALRSSLSGSESGSASRPASPRGALPA